MAQPNFNVTTTTSELLESDPDNFTLAIFKHSTIYEKYQTAIKSVSIAHKFKICLHWVLLQNASGFFHNNSYCWLSDSAQFLESRHLDWHKHNACGARLCLALK